MSATATKAKKAKGPARPPELKIGPFQGGIGVAVWLNEVETPTGSKMMRSVSIAPRRYLDKETGQWRDAKSFRPGDLAALILALEKSLEYCLTHPLPGEQSEDERLVGANGDGDIPY